MIVFDSLLFLFFLTVSFTLSRSTNAKSGHLIYWVPLYTFYNPIQAFRYVAMPSYE